MHIPIPELSTGYPPALPQMKLDRMPLLIYTCVVAVLSHKELSTEMGHPYYDYEESSHYVYSSPQSSLPALGGGKPRGLGTVEF